MRLIALALLVPSYLAAQPAAPRSPADTLRSPVIGANGSVTFQLYAPKATAVVLRGGLPAELANRKLARNDAGVWTLDVTLPPDVYVYWFDVDGVPVVDPKNRRVRANRSFARSVVEVPGAASAFLAERDVPHGTVSTIWYRSTVLGAPRRMHVYTPPGYETSGARYPVLYLLHGSGDTDEGWLAAGRANFILDNLIAAGKAKPMIVVMPDGHAPPSETGAIADPAAVLADIGREVPAHVEARYRVRPGRGSRAIAGLSMGGAQALEIALSSLDRFDQIGVFSSGFLGAGGPDAVAAKHRRVLDDPGTPGRVSLLWIATGKEDFLLPQTKATLAILDRSRIAYAYQETEGGHTWPNWRAYLAELAPLLFR